ncbi:MAG: DeoR/GlpR family DNA-binding transcription regulator [Chitinivibrionales bacterium]|nr:DeoR/GlpR family DNA-binding transcription regulator [Chitinivibrionales bacterium]
MRTDRFRQTRREAICDLLRARPELSVAELAGRFAVTGATIRSDLAALHRESRLIRTLGGAMALDPAHALPLQIRLKQNTAAKRAIARAACGLVREGDIIALDASSTALALASALGVFTRLTVVTNCLAVVQELAMHRTITVIMPEGALQRETASLVGAQTVRSLSHFRVTTVFLGARSISLQHGLGEIDQAEIEVKRSLVSIAGKVVALLDSGKWQQQALQSVVPIGKIDMVVTDADIRSAQVTALQRRGITVLIGR